MEHGLVSRAALVCWKLAAKQTASSSFSFSVSDGKCLARNESEWYLSPSNSSLLLLMAQSSGNGLTPCLVVKHSLPAIIKKKEKDRL